MPSPSDVTGLANQVRHLLSRHLHTRRFRKGSLLWSEGDTSGMLVTIRVGRVKIYRLLPNGRAVTLYLFGPNDVFGFLPFLDGMAYPAYAQAITEVEADVLPRSSLLEALRAEPELAVTLITLLGRRLRTAFDHIQHISTPGARARVASALIPLIPEDNDPVVELPVSSLEFAGALGLAPETLSRAITGLVDGGVLERAASGHYRVLDLVALKQASAPPLD